MLILQLPVCLWRTLFFVPALMGMWWIWESWYSQVGSLCPWYSSLNQCYSRFCDNRYKNLGCFYWAVKHHPCWYWSLVSLQAFGKARTQQRQPDLKTSQKKTYWRMTVMLYSSGDASKGCTEHLLCVQCTRALPAWGWHTLCTGRNKDQKDSINTNEVDEDRPFCPQGKSCLCYTPYLI